jgi:hypothetical protein
MPGARPRPVVAGARRVLNVVESPDDVWDALAAGPLEDVDPPARLDLTAGRPWYAIRDQGETGSCVGWALADSVMRWQLVELGMLAPRQRLSARFIWMASKEWQAQRLGQEHGTLAALLDSWQPTTFLEEAATMAKDGLEVARLLGAVPEPVLRWSGPLNRGPEAAFWERARKYRLKGYYAVDAGALEVRLRRWRQWLAQHGPLMIIVEMDRTMLAGEPVLDTFRVRRREDLHACALVGYDDEGFILRNSWGTRWGRRGYALARPDWLRRAVRESYGVDFPASTPAS